MDMDMKEEMLKFRELFLHIDYVTALSPNGTEAELAEEMRNLIRVEAWNRHMDEVEERYRLQEREKARGGR